ncbi:MAG: AAA family ATPase [Candidatus Aenigmarchaeota archaeon]|nr:AAA family ATPase [Candidatus Aenigmarchaeota archaeon]
MVDAVWIGGVHAVGKSTIIKGADLLGRDVVSVSKEMVRYANQYGITNDMLNRLPYDERARVGDETFKAIARANRKVIVDSHYTILIMDGTMPRSWEMGIPDWLAKNHITGYLLVEAAPEQVLARRVADHSDAGERRSKDLAVVEYELHMERRAAEYYSNAAGLQLHVIQNTGSVEQAQREFSDALRSVESKIK